MSILKDYIQTIFCIWYIVSLIIILWTFLIRFVLFWVDFILLLIQFSILLAYLLLFKLSFDTFYAIFDAFYAIFDTFCTHFEVVSCTFFALLSSDLCYFWPSPLFDILDQFLNKFSQLCFFLQCNVKIEYNVLFLLIILYFINKIRVEYCARNGLKIGAKWVHNVSKNCAKSWIFIKIFLHDYFCDPPLFKYRKTSSTTRTSSITRTRQ